MKKGIRDIELSIRRISEKASEVEDCVRWDIGQPSFDTPQHVKDAAKESLEEKQGYSPTKGVPELREAVTREENLKNGIEIDPENVMITTGGMEAIYSIFAARLDSSDTVTLNDPCWGPYKLISAVNGNSFTQKEYFRDGKLTDEAHEAARESEMLVVNTPSNPAGRVLDEGQARAIAELAEDHGCFLLSDEVYWRLTFGREHVSPARFVEDSAIVGSTSKNHAMTGWRIGWVADSENSIDEYAKVSRAVTACPNRVGQRAAVEALENDSHVEEMRDEYRERRDEVEQRMHNLGWSFTRPGGAIYAFPDVERDSWKFCMEMIEKGVAMVPGEPFGSRSDTNVRIAYGSTTIEEIQKGFDILEDELK